MRSVAQSIAHAVRAHAYNPRRDRTSAPPAARRAARSRRAQTAQEPTSPSSRRPSTCSSRSSTCSAACSRACRCRGFSPTPAGSRAQQRGRPPARALRRHPARLDRLPADAPADRRHPAPLRGARARRATSRSSRSAATATRSSRWSTQWYDATSGVDGGDRRTRAAGRARRASIRCWCSRCGRFWRAAPRRCCQRVDFSALAARALPVLRLGAGLRGDHAERRSPADLRPLRRAVGVRRRSTCPFCANDDRALITSFATRDGRYRVYACDVCRRYLKAYDAPERAAAGDGGGGFDRDAAARRGGDAAGIRRAER